MSVINTGLINELMGQDWGPMVSAAARRHQLCHMTPSCDITKLAG